MGQMRGPMHCEIVQQQAGPRDADKLVDPSMLLGANIAMRGFVQRSVATIRDNRVDEHGQPKRDYARCRGDNDCPINSN